MGQVLDAHIDSIADLEEHKNEITKKVEVIDQALEKINDKIQMFEGKHNKDEFENNPKVCHYNNFGLCKNEKKGCSFYHSEETCDNYIENGIDED